MNLTPIRRLVKRTKQSDPKTLGRDAIVYIDISSIDRQTKRITEPQILAVDEAPSRARKQVHANDVLVSTVRPNLNSVALVPPEYHSEIASTGFCVLRTNKDELDPLYLFYFTQTTPFVSRLTRLSIGAGYPAVSDDNILDTEIPLLPLSEQQRIAAILAKADRLRRLRRAALDLSDTYLQSVFLEMFGDPVSNPMGWKTAKIGTQIKSVRYGTGSPPHYHKEGVPFIRATNIKGGTVQEDGLVYISESDARRIAKCKVSAGDLILVRSGINTGDCALIPPEFDGSYAAYDLIIEVPYPQNYYYSFVINSDHGKSVIRPLSRRAGQPHINADQVKALSFPLPPLPLQQQFAAIVQKFERLSAQQREAERQAEHLFQTLLHRAFRGELGGDPKGFLETLRV